MKRAYKYRFYPDTQQGELLERTFGCVRVVWNHVLQEHSRQYKETRTSVSISNLNAILTKLKKTEGFEYLKEVSSVPLQQAIVSHQYKAFGNFFKKNAAYPNFKSRHKSKKSAEFTPVGFRYREGKLWIAKSDKPLNVIWHRALPDGAKPSTVTVSKDKANRWWVSMLVEETVQHLPKVDSEVGIDWGVSKLATLSNGKVYENPRLTKIYAKRLAQAQRAVLTKKRGSSNRDKAKLRVAKVHAKIADSRKDFLHKMTTEIVRENQAIYLQDSDYGGMAAKAKPKLDEDGTTYLPNGRAAKKGLSKAILDTAPYMMTEMLRYKAEMYGRTFALTPRFEATTGLCSGCGTINKLQLNQRTLRCAHCGLVIDRDLNAAKNILAQGHRANTAFAV